MGARGHPSKIALSQQTNKSISTYIEPCRALCVLPAEASVVFKKAKRPMYVCMYVCSVV